ncbi:hypothetical protein ACLOJK_021120 [Asimina triloba]
MNDQRLRRAISDITIQVEKITEDFNKHGQVDVEKAECECCGFSDDYTPAYICHIKNSYGGKWVCGLCSEAVKEQMSRAPWAAMKEAVDSHATFCKKYNSTTRLNPKLSLAGDMREIARRSSQNRISKKIHPSMIARTYSCNPRIDIHIDCSSNGKKKDN